MAVKFGANKSLSPRRQIFNIDTFLGVDLTNSGTSMDEVRSPNAENMVRLVPGKVRKRTGYKSKIIFTPLEDVNRAKDTTDEWKDVVLNEEVAYYETYEVLNVAWLRAEFQAVGTYKIYIYALVIQQRHIGLQARSQGQPRLHMTVYGISGK